MTRWISCLVLLVALSGCAETETGRSDAATSADARSSAAAVGSEDARRALEAELVAADRAFAKAVDDHGLAGLISRFAPSGRMVIGGESYIGSEGIRRILLPVFADTTLQFTWDPNYAEVAESGDLGYTVGRYELRASGDAAPMSETGTYLTVWTRQDDGTWKVKADIGNPDPPGAPRR